MWVAEWEWDDDNVAHIARHRVTVAQVLAVWHGDPKVRRNRKGRAATHQMLGPDAGGRFLAVFVQPGVRGPGSWRVVTARAATDAERQWWERS